MYKLKLGEVVTTIPTIGFNVETFQVDGATVTAWDVGGCDKIRPLWRHYYANTQGVVYFVAGNDRDRLDEALTELRTLTREEELADASLIVFATKQDLPDAMSVAEIDAAVERRLGRRVPVFGTSINRDPTGYHEAMSHLVGMIRDHAVGHAAPSAPPTGPSGTGGGAGGGAGGAGDAADAGDGATSGTGPRITHRPLPDREPKAKGRHMIEAGEHAGRPHNEGIAELLGEWLAREDVDDDTFIKQLCDYTLPAWDHYTHLRLAWLHLHRFGRREGMALIFERIRDFIDHSPRTAAGKTFHETMTYFWVNIVHFAMEATVNPTGDFKGLLVSNPQLVDGGLFLDYYKKATIMTPEARANVVLPDKKPMPSIVYGAAGTPSARAAATTAIKAGGVGAGGAEAMGDAESKGGEAGEVAAGRRTIAKLPDDNVALLALFEGVGDAHDGEGDGKGAGGDDDGDGDISRGGEEAEAESKAAAAAASAAVPAYLPNWGHETLIRCVWATLAAAGRRKGVDRVFAALQRVEGAGFHYTIAYYWVQMVDLCMRAEGWDGSAPDASTAGADEAAREPVPPGEPAAPAEEGKAVDATDGATVTDAQRFAAFYARHPDLRDPRLYLRHYTRATILSYKAAREMVLPDLKPLPSVVVPDAGAAGAAGAGASRGSGWSWKLW